MSDGASLPTPGIARVRAYFADAAGTGGALSRQGGRPRVGAVGFVGGIRTQRGCGLRSARHLLELSTARWRPSETTGRRLARDGGAIITESDAPRAFNATDGQDQYGHVAFLAAAHSGRTHVADLAGLKPPNFMRDATSTTTDLRPYLGFAQGSFES